MSVKENRSSVQNTAQGASEDDTNRAQLSVLAEPGLIASITADNSRWSRKYRRISKYLESDGRVICMHCALGRGSVLRLSLVFQSFLKSTLVSLTFTFL